MQHCIDLHQPKIPGGIDLGYFEFIGYGTVVDSLSAIKKLVFDEKKATMAELMDAVSSNFGAGKTCAHADERALLRQ
jgi:formate C-acetyltransferase